MNIGVFMILIDCMFAEFFMRHIDGKHHSEIPPLVAVRVVAALLFLL